MVGCGEEQGTVRQSGDSQNVFVEHHGASYHKNTSGRRAGFAVGQPLAHRLVVEGLLAVVEGVVVEGVHQVGVDVAEEHPHLRGETLCSVCGQDHHSTRSSG